MLLTKLKADARMFRLPLGEWTLKNSAWDILETPITTATLEKPAYKFDNTEDPAAQNRRVGQSRRDDPEARVAVLALHLLRSQAQGRRADQRAGQGPTGDIVPIVLQGWRRRAEELGGQQPDAQCFWAIGADETKVVQCLPWIVGKDNTNAEAKVKPDGETILRFNRGETNPFVHTVGATDRKLIDFTDATLRDRPGPARLDYYDLPKIWKSRKYFAWLSDTDCGPLRGHGREGHRRRHAPGLLPGRHRPDRQCPRAAGDGGRRHRPAVAHLHRPGRGGACCDGTDRRSGGRQAAEADASGRAAVPWITRVLYNPLTADQKSYFSKVKMNLNYVAD